MDVYLNRASLAQRAGVPKNRFDPPAPDVVIGRSRGWKRTRVRGGKIIQRHEPPLVLLSVTEVAARLDVSTARVNELRRDVPNFPPPAACIASKITGTPPTWGWAGNVFGWVDADIARFAAHTGRGQGATRGRRGRPKGSGDYEALPRCGRPLTASVNGKGRDCRAVRRKIDGVWAPACGMHLTQDERLTLGIA